MPNPNVAATNALVRRLGGAVLLGHSQAGLLPVNAMLADPTGIAGLILLEPGGCGTARFTDQQIATLATVPILVEFGDHLDTTTGTGVNWLGAYQDCQAFVARINTVGGNALMLHPPDWGIYGNSHMVMQDKNNLQIAATILAWIDRNVPTGGGGRP